MVSLAGDVGDVGAGFLHHALLATHRTASPAHVLRGLLDLFCPCHAEQPAHSMLFEHLVNGLHKRHLVGDLTLAPTSRGRQGREGFLRRTQTCCQPRCLLGGMPGRSQHQHPFRPPLFPLWRTTGPFKLIAFGRESLVPTIIRAENPF